MPEEAVCVSPLERVLGRTVPVHIVDVGANPIDGAPPYAPLLQGGAATVLGFEPNREALARLEREKGAGETYLPHALGDGGRHRLHVCAAPGMTSLLEPDPAVLGLFPGFAAWGRVLRTLEVETVRLGEVAEAQGADLLKMDVQGAELMVLEAAGTVLDAASVVHVEVEFLPLYRDQPLFGDVDRFLRGRGFVLHRFAPLSSRMVAPLHVGTDPYAGLGQLVWADAVYVRDFMAMDGWARERLLPGARVLHECYGAYDVAMRLLAEHDVRVGSGFAEPYLAALRDMAGS